MLSLLFDNVALDMKRNASGMFLEDSDDSNRDSSEFSRFWIAPRYFHLPTLSGESEKDSSKESYEDENERESRDDLVKGSEKDSKTTFDSHRRLRSTKPKKKSKAPKGWSQL